MAGQEGVMCRKIRISVGALVEFRDALERMGLYVFLCRHWGFADAPMLEEARNNELGVLQSDEGKVRANPSSWDEDTFATVFCVPKKGFTISSSCLQPEICEVYFDSERTVKEGYVIARCHNTELREITRLLARVLMSPKISYVAGNLMELIVLSYTGADVNWAQIIKVCFRKMITSLMRGKGVCFASPYLYHVYAFYSLLNFNELREYNVQMESLQVEILKKSESEHPSLPAVLLSDPAIPTSDVPPVCTSKAAPRNSWLEKRDRTPSFRRALDQSHEESLASPTRQTAVEPRGSQVSPFASMKNIVAREVSSDTQSDNVSETQKNALLQQATLTGIPSNRAKKRKRSPLQQLALFTEVSVQPVLQVPVLTSAIADCTTGDATPVLSIEPVNATKLSEPYPTSEPTQHLWPHQALNDASNSGQLLDLLEEVPTGRIALKGYTPSPFIDQPLNEPITNVCTLQRKPRRTITEERSKWGRCILNAHFNNRNRSETTKPPPGRDKGKEETSPPSIDPLRYSSLCTIAEDLARNMLTHAVGLSQVERLSALFLRPGESVEVLEDAVVGTLEEMGRELDTSQNETMGLKREISTLKTAAQESISLTQHQLALTELRTTLERTESARVAELEAKWRQVRDDQILELDRLLGEVANLRQQMADMKEKQKGFSRFTIMTRQTYSREGAPALVRWLLNKLLHAYEQIGRIPLSVAINTVLENQLQNVDAREHFMNRQQLMDTLATALEEHRALQLSITNSLAAYEHIADVRRMTSAELLSVELLQKLMDESPDFSAGWLSANPGQTISIAGTFDSLHTPPLLNGNMSPSSQPTQDPSPNPSLYNLDVPLPPSPSSTSNPGSALPSHHSSPSPGSSSPTRETFPPNFSSREPDSSRHHSPTRNRTNTDISVESYRNNPLLPPQDITARINQVELSTQQRLDAVTHRLDSLFDAIQHFTQR